jgi:DNA-3-methyladenine glycosylase
MAQIVAVALLLRSVTTGTNSVKPPARLPHTFYVRDARYVARDLLGRILVTEIGGDRTSGRIIETEAYLGTDDLASHSHRGPTQRNRAMFMRGGHAYVYFIYGMYYCFNVVTGEPGAGEAVLIRGLEPLEGIETMRARRGAKLRRDADLTNGPGKLAISLGIGPELDGADLRNDLRIWIEPGEPLDNDEVMTTPRIGITKSVEHPWRWVRR